MTRGPLSRRSLLSLGMVVALGAVGCADVDIHGPNAWGPWDPNFPDGRSRDFSAEAPFARQVEGFSRGTEQIAGGRLVQDFRQKVPSGEEMLETI